MFIVYFHLKKLDTFQMSRKVQQRRGFLNQVLSVEILEKIFGSLVDNYYNIRRTHISLGVKDIDAKFDTDDS